MSLELNDVLNREKKEKFYDNGDLYIQEWFKNGVKCGEECVFYRNHILSSITTYYKGKKNGPYRKHLVNGTIIEEGNYVNDKFNGTRILYDKDGRKKLVENYTRGKLDGIIKKYDNGLVIEKCTYKRGVLDGLYTYWCPSPYYKVREEEYKDDILTNAKEFYDNNRIKFTETYKDGRLEGSRKGFHYNGNLQFDENYVDGVLCGIRTLWYTNEKLKLEENYKNGKLNGRRTIKYRHGITYKEEMWKNDKLHGECHAWFLNGVLSGVFNYKHGKLHGECLGWYIDKSPCVTQTYENGLLVGKSTKWKKGGELWRFEYYDAGKLIQIEEFRKKGTWQKFKEKIKEKINKKFKKKKEGEFLLAEYNSI